MICQVRLHSWCKDKRKARSCSSRGSTHHHLHPPGVDDDDDYDVDDDQRITILVEMMITLLSRSLGPSLGNTCRFSHSFVSGWWSMMEYPGI